MISIAEGMTPAEFVAAININTPSVKAGGIVEINTSMSGSELAAALNNNLEVNNINVGITSGVLVYTINNHFSSYDISLDQPTGVVIEWVDDFARIIFNDNTSGIAYHEIWEERNNEGYTLSHILSPGVESDDYYTWQGASLNYRIRAKQGDKYSLFTDVEVVDILPSMTARCFFAVVDLRFTRPWTSNYKTPPTK
jgi:hypothetical protein